MNLHYFYQVGNACHWWRKQSSSKRFNGHYRDIIKDTLDVRHKWRANKLEDGSRKGHSTEDCCNAESHTDSNCRCGQPSDPPDQTANAPVLSYISSQRALGYFLLASLPSRLHCCQKDRRCLTQYCRDLTKEYLLFRRLTTISFKLSSFPIFTSLLLFRNSVYS